jgi:hypothetical protein
LLSDCLLGPGRMVKKGQKSASLLGANCGFLNSTSS